ncbi:MAG: cysteine desulfurase [Candidatus Binatia bacterium]
MSRGQATCAAVRAGTAPELDVGRVRGEFPALGQTVHGRPLVYLDTAATAQKPRVVIDAIARFYAEGCANVHRGAHALAERATTAHETARTAVQRFMNAREAREIVFVRGTTEAINLVAHGYGRTVLGAGDEVVISAMEHHSNIVPWQRVCRERGAVLRVAPIDDAGDLVLEAFAALLGPRTKLVAVAHVSNALGTVNPIEAIVGLAHARGIPVLVDGAQAVPHLDVDVQALGCDFYAWSGHKLYGPSGIGVLYARAALLETMEPYQTGSGMIASVAVGGATWADLPHRFEAGTPDVAGAIGLATAVDWVQAIGLETIAAHDADLLRYAAQRLAEQPRVRFVGTARRKVGILSFVVDGIHPHDVATVLDREGIAVRAGHQCAQPVMERFGLAGTTRASFGVYTTREEIDALVAGVRRVVEVLG